MQAPLACWRCEQPGHGWRECDRPPAKTKQELDARKNRILERWDAGYGEISTSLKTEFIRQEIRAYQKETARK